MEIGNIKPVLEPTPVVTVEKNGDAGQVKELDRKQLESPKENREKTQEELKEAVDKLNKTAVIFDRSLRFQVHDATHRTMVSVVDITNDKVIRQIPNEEVLDLVAKMDDYMGLIFDKKA
ncbi:MAG: hypothetical protein A2W80_02485 [Candidatus Riflebacteria bacterium GWC2_50_8]|nr:MAG: hypothetical protein A2W80_02485 [Candidatus Riflebacteria bacterium GWC2_50_8]